MQNLDDLVTQAESIATNLEDDEVPHIHRNIEQLRRRGETFYNRVAQNDIKAAKLLGNKVGYELSAGLSKTLESLNVLSSYDGLSSINIEDIPSFLRNERETAILSAINITRSNTLNTSYKLCEQAKSDWWKREKSNILNLLVNSDKISNLIPLGLNKISQNSGENLHFTKTVLSKEEIQYAREISKYIDNLLSHTEFRENISLLQLLDSDSSPMNNTKCSELSEILRLVKSYCEFRRNYSQSSLVDLRECDSELSKGMVVVALQHLENEYCSYARQYVNGLSDNVNEDMKRLMSIFVENNLLCQLDSNNFEDESVMGVPVWPLIFACLRAGLHYEAISIAKDASSNLGEFYTLIEIWVNRGALSNEQARKLTIEYKRHVRASSDGCKRLVYSLLAGCDMEEVHGGVLNTVDDFMWLRLCQLKRVTKSQSEQNVSKYSYSHPIEPHYSLIQLQTLISEEYGENHFKATQQPLTYCRILLLCQLFEPALAFLTRFEHLRCHAIQLALVLWQNNLLLISYNLDAPLLSRCEDDQHGLSKLNLMRLVTLYTRKFEASHPKDALDLFFILKDLHCDSDDVNGFVTCATSLAVESGQMELLFGRIVDDDGHNRPGLLLRYGSVADPVLEAVSRRLRQSGRIEAACDAMQLAGRFQEAATDLAELLVSTVSLPSNHPNVMRLQAKADYFLARMPESSESVLLCCILTITRFIFSSADGDIEAALAALDRTHLLPTSSDVGSIRSATESFRNLPELVRSLFPGLLVSAMQTLRGVAKLRQNSQDSLVDIRRRAAALITFTGQLPYRMPSEVYASLSQLELEIN